MMEGNNPHSFAWYLSAIPTVSTNTYVLSERRGKHGYLHEIDALAESSANKPDGSVVRNFVQIVIVSSS